MGNFLKTLVFVLLVAIMWVKIAHNTSNLPTQQDFDKVNNIVLVSNDLGV